MSAVDHTVYAALWLVFGVVHSLLARDFMKRRLLRYVGKAYRAWYNVIALVHFVMTVAVAKYLLAPDSVALFSAPHIQLLFGAVMWAGAILIVAALLHYDLGTFSGLKQLRSNSPHQSGEDEGNLHFTGLHQYVRHPLYTGVFLFLWGSVRTEFDAATALWATLYVLVGTYFEERSLVARFGGEYEAYQKRVPAFLPWKGRQR